MNTQPYQPFLKKGKKQRDLVHVFYQSHVLPWPTKCYNSPLWCTKPQHNKKAWPSSFIILHVTGNSENTLDGITLIGRVVLLLKSELAQLKKNKKPSTEPYLFFSLSMPICLFLCYGGVRIYFGGVWIVPFQWAAAVRSPPPTGLMWPTFIAGIETHCERQPIGRDCFTAKRRSAQPQTMGFRRLHNLPHSLIHFNYLIHLLCNLHNLFGVLCTVWLQLYCDTKERVKCLHSWFPLWRTTVALTL